MTSHFTMMSTLALVILAVFGTSLAQECNLAADCLGTIVDSGPVDSKKECLSWCQTNDKCTWYTFDEAFGGFCNLLSDCDQTNPGCTTCTSGERTCPLIQCHVEGKCAGTYLDRVEAANADECLTACYKNHTDCNWYSYFADNQLCQMFRECQLDEDATGVVSGERDCYYELNKGMSKIFLQIQWDANWVHMPSRFNASSHSTCAKPPPYPIQVQDAVGAVVEGSIVICGGYDHVNFDYLSQCYRLDAATNIWMEFPSLDKEREAAASVMTEQGWWITGGYGRADFQSSSVLFDPATETWSAGPDIPSMRYGHCMAQINSTATFLAGGWASITFDEAWIYSWTDDVWTELPNMSHERYEFACGVHTSAGGVQSIIVAGGYYDAHQFAESFDLQTGSWMQLPNLLTQVRDPKMVHDGQDLILVNTWSDNLMRYDEARARFVIIDGQNAAGFDGLMATTIAVSDESLYNCK